MKPFNLEEAKAGKPVCTRDGRKVKILTYDRKGSCYPIVALVEDSKGNEDAYGYTLRGEYIEGQEDKSDLMMVGEKKEGWVNIYKCDLSTYNAIALTSNYIYNTKEAAEAGTNTDERYIATIKIEWE